VITDRPRAVTTLLPALVGGGIGFLLAGLLASALVDSHSPPRNLAVGFLGGGIGWFIGAVVGMIRTRAAPPGSSTEARALRAAAMILVPAGFAVAWWIPSTADWISLGETLKGNRFTALKGAIVLDAALVAVTCLILAQTSLRRVVIAIGAIAALFILIALAFQIGSELTRG